MDAISATASTATSTANAATAASTSEEVSEEVHEEVREEEYDDEYPYCHPCAVDVASVALMADDRNVSATTGGAIARRSDAREVSFVN